MRAIPSALDYTVVATEVTDPTTRLGHGQAGDECVGALLVSSCRNSTNVGHVSGPGRNNGDILHCVRYAVGSAVVAAHFAEARERSSATEAA